MLMHADSDMRARHDGIENWIFDIILGFFILGFFTGVFTAGRKVCE
jgi:hypothetical protein